jgi:hypothetical protein
MATLWAIVVFAFVVAVLATVGAAFVGMFGGFNRHAH